MCKLFPKKPNIEEKKPKSQAIFLTPTTSKKATFVKFGVKKTICNPDAESQENNLCTNHLCIATV